MDKLSKDIRNKKEAVAAAEALAAAEEIIAFVDGDDRYEVIAAAEVRLQELEAGKNEDSGRKQGQETGRITRTTDDFKTGVQGTKGSDGDQVVSEIPHSALRTPQSHITGSDIVAAVDEADKKKADEAEKGAPAVERVTGESVVAAIDEADAKKASDLERQAAEAEKARKAGKVNPDIVTAETVIKKMREEGKRI